MFNHLIRIKASIVLIIALLLTNFSHLQARWLLNQAQVQFLHGIDQLAQYQQALKLASEDENIRWQAGAALVRSGDIRSAGTVLLPLAHWETNLNVMHLLLSSLLTARRDDIAMQVYQSTTLPLHLPVGVATRLLINARIQTAIVLSNDQMKNLLANTFGLDTSTPAFQKFATNTIVPEFWQQALGKQLSIALQWRQRSSSPTEIACGHKDIHSSNNIAQLLGVQTNQFELGHELVSNGDFEIYDSWADTPNAWHEAFLTAGTPWNLALFLPGVDTQLSFSGCRALRIDGLYIEHSAEHEPARAGFIYDPIPTLANQPYVISFVYRTSADVHDLVSMWISQDPKVLFANELALAPTQDSWKQVTIIAWNRKGEQASIQPFLRSWSEGSVWFDNFSMRPLLLKTPITEREAIIDIHNIE